MKNIIVCGIVFLVSLSACTFEMPITRCGCDERHADVRVNTDILMLCCDCTAADAPVVEESFRLQTQAYACLQQAFGFTPGLNQDDGLPYITYRFSHLTHPTAEESWSYGQVQCGTTVTTLGFMGHIFVGETAVRNADDVMMDTHETMHAFTRVGLGIVPNWINEGFSIATEDWLVCSPRSYGANSLRMEMGMRDWHHIQRHEPLEYRNTLEPHQQGGAFFAALREEAGCEMNCVRDIWNGLRAQHANGDRITTAVVEEVATRVTRYDVRNITRRLLVSDQYDDTPAAYP